MTDNLTVYAPVGGAAEKNAVEQIKNVLADERAVQGALMADHHLGYSMPIGGVVAYQDAVSPTGVGFDIACGNMAVKTDVYLGDLTGDLRGRDWHGVNEGVVDAVKPLMRRIQKTVAFGLGRSNPTPVGHELFDDDAWLWLESVSPGLKKKAEQQLGTVGSGNHYVDLLAESDDSGRIWVANHFGSRGLGHTIASGFMALAANRKFTERVPETEQAVVFDTDSEVGSHYIACMNLAGRYAYAGREYVINQVLGILGAAAVESVHNHHNYAWLEDGLWIVRKGATPLTREPAFIGGSMGDVSVIVQGARDTEADEHPARQPVFDIGALGSAPHGAGRVMSRTKAAGKMRRMWLCPGCKGTFFQPDDPVCPTCGATSSKKVRARDVSTAAIDWASTRESLTKRGIVVLGAGADESPGVYKSLASVLSAHQNIEVLHSLHPVGVVMAGPDQFDPYKD